MKRVKIILFLLFVFAYCANAQTKLEINNDTLILTLADGTVRGYSQVTAWQSEPAVGKFTIIGSGYSNSFYLSSITTLRVNGVNLGVSFSNVNSSIKNFSSTHSVGSGGGGSTSNTTEATQLTQNTILNGIKDTITNGNVTLRSAYKAILDSSIKTDFAKYVKIFQDSITKLIAKPSSAGVSDSAFIKLATQAIKDSSGYSLIKLIAQQDSTTLSRKLVTISNPYSVLATDSVKYRKTLSIDNFPAQQDSTTLSRKLVSIDRLPQAIYDSLGVENTTSKQIKNVLDVINNLEVTSNDTAAAILNVLRLANTYNTRQLDSLAGINKTLKDTLTALIAAVKNQTQAPATFGATSGAWQSINNTTLSINLTNALSVWIVNTGTTDITVTSGTLVETLTGCNGCTTKSQFIFDAKLDASTNKYVPIFPITVNATGGNVRYLIQYKQ